MAAVHLAFSEHRPLVLSPDDFWITLAQGFARHVDENAEALRARFIRHQGRRALTVTAFDGAPRAGWESILEAFETAVARFEGDEAAPR